MRHLSRWLVIPAISVVLLACGESSTHRPVKVSEAFPQLPLPPGEPVLVSKSVSENAMQLHLTTTSTPEEVLNYYHFMLKRPPWRITREAPMPDGSAAIYAEDDKKHPLWVTIRRGDGGVGSAVDLVGAVVPKDSTPAGQ